MARIFFAWELGGEYGHVVACAALARALQARGHAIAFMLRDLHPLSMLPETRAYDVFQAPRYAQEGRTNVVPASYADIMLGCGYSDSDALTTLVEGWRKALEQWKPDLVVADFAPTALLAARLMGLRKVTYGNGFFTPPRLDPLPPFRFDEPVPAARLRESNDRVLANVNIALAKLGGAKLERLAEQFEAEEDFLCTLPELDHYGSRPVSGYWGPRFRFDRGHEMQWPKGPGKRIFVYVKPSLPQLDALLEPLVRGPYRSLVFIPGLDAARKARLASARCAVSDRPVRLDKLMKECDLMVCHGGEIATGALMHGVPQLLIPSHYEQYLTSNRLQQLGSGGWLGPRAEARDVSFALERMAQDGRFAERARAFAARYRDFSSAEQRRRIALHIDKILGATGADSLPHGRAAPILTPSQTGQETSG